MDTKIWERVLQGEIKDYLETSIKGIETHHPEVEIEEFSIHKDHVHLVISIPPKYSVSSIIGKIKANTSREIRQRFDLKNIYWGKAFCSVGFLSSTVGIDEEVIKRYVEFQEKADKEQLKLEF